MPPDRKERERTRSREGKREVPFGEYPRKAGVVALKERQLLESACLAGLETCCDGE